MKILIIFLFAMMGFAHHGGGSGGSVGPVGRIGGGSDYNGVPTVIPMPVSIMHDGTVEFSWDWWGFGMEDHHDETVVPDEQSEPEHLHWYFSPLLFVNGDKFKILINQQEQNLDKALSLESAQGSYLVLEKGNFEVGLGGGVHAPFESGIMVGAGLFPIVGISVYSERYAASLEAANQLPKIKFPKDASALDSWSPNDIMIYNRKGGISFFAHAGFSGLTAGVGYFAKGEWRVTLKKTGEGKIFASVSKVSIQSLSTFAGIEFANLNIGLFGGHDKSFSFEFDLNNKSGQESFNEFLKGNFKFSKNLLAGEKMEGVVAISESQTQIFGRAFGVHMGLPFLSNLEFSKSLVKSFSQIHSLKENKKVQNTMSVYSRSLETSGVLSRRTSDLIMFAAGHQQLLENEKHEGHDHGNENGKSYTTANFKWMFSRLRVKANVFQREVEDLKRITGLWSTLDFELPQDRLGYTKLEFDGMISSQGTLKILAQTKNLSADDKIETFFNKDMDPSRVCKVLKNIDSCKKHMIKTTYRALKAMEKKIVEMKKLFQDKDWKKFTEAYALLGKEALTNQFSFQTFMDLVGRKNFSMEFKVSGEKLKTLYIHNFEADLI